jgi:hypothetical protein
MNSVEKSQLLPDRRGGRPERLSLSAYMAGGPLPTPGPGEGEVTTLFSRSRAGTTVASLLRGADGFNHLRESLNLFIHTGGPRRRRSFRRRLRQWH